MITNYQNKMEIEGETKDAMLKKRYKKLFGNNEYGSSVKQSPIRSNRSCDYRNTDLLYEDIR